MTDQDMAARHRARFRSIQIIRVEALKTDQIRRSYTKQLIVNTSFSAIACAFFSSPVSCLPGQTKQEKDIKFPLPHRVARPSQKKFRGLFAARRPTTHS